MLTENEIQTNAISITPAAAQAVSDLLAKRNLEGYALRVFVQGGGCSGFQYGMALDGNQRDNDIAFDLHGVKVLVDEISIQYLTGATVDYEENLMGGGFKIENPNAVSSCGCGSSFRTQGDAAQDSAGGCGSCS